MMDVIRAQVMDSNSNDSQDSKELSQIQNRMEFALEATGAIVWDWQVTADKVTFHPPSQTLYNADIETVDEFLQQIHPEDRDQVVTTIETALEETGEYSTEFRIFRDDDIRWVSDHGRVQYDGETPTRMVGVAQDITERKEREQRLERLSRFAGDITHDLANPLNTLDGWLGLARETGEEDYLERCEQIVKQMERLVKDMSAFAQEGGATLDPESVALGDIATDCWETIETADAELHVNTEMTIQADPAKLHTILTNLMRNAVEHGGPDVTVTIGPLADELGFYVEDDGPGIPPVERDQVFERGFSQSAQGTGFGLAIVEKLVDVHGWDITVTEGSEGGARFEILDVEFAT